MPTDLKTIMYSMTPDSGGFPYLSVNNEFNSIQLNNGANWTDQTIAVGPTKTTGVNLLNIGGTNYGAVGSVWYLGKSEMFDSLGLHFASGTDNTGTRTVTYEYWNGSAWVVLAQSGSSQRVTALQGNLILSNTSQYSFKISNDIYVDWATTSVNGSAPLYFIRMTIGVSALTSATLQSVSCYNHRDRVGSHRFDRILTTIDDAAFTDQTLAGRSNVSGAFTFTANTTNARIYLMSSTNNITGFIFLCSTAGTVGTGVWEYWNGSAWATLTYNVAGQTSSNASGKQQFLSTITTIIHFKYELADWASSSVNGISGYWIRFRVTSNYTVSPILQYIVGFRVIEISRTVWIPESTNRVIQSAFIKLHLYNPIVASLQRISAVGKIGSNPFKPLHVGSSQQTVSSSSTFIDIGGKVFSTTANDGAFTDETNDASTSSTNDVGVTNSINANLYFCYPNEDVWNKYEILLAITNNGASVGGTVVWEYWNGSAWTNFEPIFLNTNKAINSTGSTTLYIQIPKLAGWTANTVNSFTGYIFRRRITATYTTASTISQILTSRPGYTESSYTNSSENNAISIYLDATELFKSDFSGTSQTFAIRLAMQNISGFTGDLPVASGELFITYGADTQNTRIKSVIIPLNGINDNTTLSVTLQTLGSTELPDLATYLPEASKVIRNFYVVATGNDIINTPMTTEYCMKIGSSAERVSYGLTSHQLTGNVIKLIYVDDSISTGAAQDIQLRVSSRHQNLRNISYYAVVTYEYDASITTRTINSLVLPYETSSISLPQGDPNYPERIRHSFFIEEPGTIDNVRIGAYIYFGDTATPRVFIKEKSESTYKTLDYTSTQNAGGYRYGYRIPITTLSRGLNEIGIDMYGEQNSTNSLPSCFYTCGYFVINYHSDVFSGGIEKHNKTISCLHQIQNINVYRNNKINDLSNPLPSWYINTFGLMGEFYFLGAGNNPSIPNTVCNFDVRYIWESNNQGKTVLGAGGVIFEASDTSFFDMITSDRDVVKKYPGDLHDHRIVDIFGNGRWLTEYGFNMVIGGSQTIAVCHEITFTVTGTVSGYSGDGSGLVVTFYDDATSEALFSTTTAIGGTFSAPWYDNTREIVCDVYDPILDKYAESSPGIAGIDSFDMNLPSGTIVTSYAFIG